MFPILFCNRAHTKGLWVLLSIFLRKGKCSRLQGFRLGLSDLCEHRCFWTSVFWTLATWCQELTPWKRPWCWERLRAGGEGDDRGWDDWMFSLTRWTWVWASSRSWWWTEKPGVLQSMGSQSIGHNWATELNWILFLNSFLLFFFLMLVHTCTPGLCPGVDSKQLNLKAPGTQFRSWRARATNELLWPWFRWHQKFLLSSVTLVMIFYWEVRKVWEN